nr:T9SS type A sorting domain-containing protein [Ignavibacteriaceae bacterium]
SGVAWDIDFRNENEAWASLGGEQKLIFSLDAGVTWTPVSTPDSSMIFKLIFPDSLHGFGVGTNGTIIKYKPDISDVQNEEEFSPDGFMLFQNYPNPFNPTTNIGFRISNFEFVSLKVYDVLGREVATLVNEELAAGSYEINFSDTDGSASGGDAYNLPSGVYFYQLKIVDPSTGLPAGRQGSRQSFTSTKKMILLR